jgi:hypothetical protein
MAGRVAGTFAPTHADMRQRCQTLVLAAESRPALAAANQLAAVATARQWFDAQLATRLLASPTSGAVLHIARWIAACHNRPLPETLARAVIGALDSAEPPDTADALWQLVINDVRMSGPLLADATAILATTIDLAARPLATTKGGDRVADLARVRMRAILEILLLLLRQPGASDDAVAALRTLILAAFARLPLDALDYAENTVRRLVIRSSAAFRGHGTALLDDLLVDFPNLSGSVQLGTAMAARQERGATSQEFRTLASRATDPTTHGYIVSQLA